MAFLGYCEQGGEGAGGRAEWQRKEAVRRGEGPATKAPQQDSRPGSLGPEALVVKEPKEAQTMCRGSEHPALVPLAP